MTVLFEEGFRYLVEVARCEGVETALYHQIEEVGVVNALRVSGFGFRVSVNALRVSGFGFRVSGFGFIV
jgi:hypothetical protein